MIAVRQVSAEALPAIMRVMNDAFPKDFGESWSESQCRSFLAMPGCAVLVAGEGDHVDGFAFVRTVLDEAELMMIAVHPDNRGHGIARAILAQVKIYCAVQQVVKLHLEVREGNSAAINLYKGDQFVRTGLRPEYYKGPDGIKANSITFSCELSQY